jgi:hypothetical protein
MERSQPAIALFDAKGSRDRVYFFLDWPAF